MTIIADSGSTKTDWRLLKSGTEVNRISTDGLNPYFWETQVMAEYIKTGIADKINRVDIKEIYFYGAGCSNKKNNSIVKEALGVNFPGAKIDVYHDLLAAARALCGKNEGIAGILGTGSNSCYYDGKKIVENVISLGYILGDEGSGNHLGRTFIRAYLYDEVPEKLSKKFSDECGMSKYEIIDAIYKKPFPNRFLASFSKFLKNNIHEKYAAGLVAQCFQEYFEKQVRKYKKHKSLEFGCVGSVGFYFKDILKNVAGEKGIRVGKILESPMEGLIEFHRA